MATKFGFPNTRSSQTPNFFPHQQPGSGTTLYFPCQQHKVSTSFLSIEATPQVHQTNVEDPYGAVLLDSMDCRMAESTLRWSHWLCTSDHVVGFDWGSASSMHVPLWLPKN